LWWRWPIKSGSVAELVSMYDAVNLHQSSTVVGTDRDTILISMSKSSSRKTVREDYCGAYRIGQRFEKITGRIVIRRRVFGDHRIIHCG
jgi:hypothetical protein